MNTFKFRAECLADAKFIIDDILEDIATDVSYEREFRVSDCEVQFTADTDLVSIKNMITLFTPEEKEIHVILDTIQYLDKYTGERTYEN